MAYPTLEDRLVATGGRPAGFDYLRIGLAIAVIFFHSFDLTAGDDAALHAMHGIFRPIDALVLPMFFSLSGFLVAGSLERSRTLISFLGLRVIRLVPALFVEVVFSAVIIGLLFTQLPYRDYFENPMFSHYFLNIIGDIHFRLPGVFITNPSSGTVNQQLWTIPWEMRCYLAIAIIAAFGVARRAKLFVASVIVLNVVLFVHHGFLGTRHLHHAIDGGSFDGILLVLSFLYGIAFYLLRSSIVWLKWIFFAATPAVLLLTSLPYAFFGDWLAPSLVAYITIYLGLLEPRRSKLVSSGDYSYGVYLYGFPVQQAMVATLGVAGMHWYVNFPLSLAVAAMLAIASWHLVEKHAAGLRPLLFKGESAVMDRYAALRERLVPVAGIEPVMGEPLLGGVEQREG